MKLSAIFAPDKAEKEERKDDDESAGGYKARHEKSQPQRALKQARPESKTAINI